MASLNRVVLIGNLTRDPELRYIPSGTAICTFGLALNERYKQGDEWKEKPVFVDINVWGKQGENCSEYLGKGRQVCVEGRLNFSQWETDEGQKRSKLDVTADRVVFLGSRGEPAGSGGGGGAGARAPMSNTSGEDDVPF